MKSLVVLEQIPEKNTKKNTLMIEESQEMWLLQQQKRREFNLRYG